MKRYSVIAAVVALLIAASLPMAAQGTTSGLPFPNNLILQGAGASIGASARDLTSGDAEKEGVSIDSVLPESPAARAGFKAGDIVVEFDGEKVRSVRGFSRLVQETAPGKTVKAVIVRDGRRQTLDVTPERTGRFTARVPPNIDREIERGLRTLPPTLPFDLDELPIGPRARLGATLLPASDQLLEHFGAKTGVLVSTVAPDSAAARAGLKAGDVITSINERRIDRPTDVTVAVRDAGPGGTLRLHVIRDRKESTLTVTLPQRERTRTEGPRSPV